MLWDDMSLRHYMKNGVLVVCRECKMYDTPGDREPCKSCLDNQKKFDFGDPDCECFFQPKRPEEYERLESFLKTHEDAIHQLYKDSLILGIPMLELTKLWKNREILRKYCGDTPPQDILEEAKKADVPIENFKFQLRHNYRLLNGRFSE